jgi:integrase
VRRLTEGLGGPVSVITPKVVRRYVYDSSVSTSTRATRYRYTSAFLNSIGLGKVIGAVERPKPEKKLPVACSAEELIQICRAAAKRYRELRKKNQIQTGKVIWRVPAWQFSFLTGLRRSELKRLHWEDVRPDHIVLRKQKRRREERLPISKKAQQLLRRVAFSAREGYVFSSPYSEGRGKAWADRMTRSFTEYRRRAGVREEVTLHSLRAGFITQLAKAGLSAVAIKRLARHKSIETSLRYIEATGESFRDDLDAAFG